MSPLILDSSTSPPASGQPWVVTLDPSAVASGRTPLNLNSGPIRVSQKGIDWGDAAIQAYLAQESRYGSTVVDFTIPNRTVTIPLGLGMDDSESGETARAQLQQKVGLLQREGGWLLRQRDSGPAMYADIVNATLGLPDVWGETGDVEPDVVLTLTCLPDFYGDEITLDSISATGVFDGTLTQDGATAMIEGDHPARCRLIVTDTSGNDQKGVVWGVRSRHYDSGATAALQYEAEALTAISPATVVSLPGASGGSAIEYSSLPASWVPVMGTDSASASMTHTGSYRVWARVQASAATVYLRLAWTVGVAINPVINDSVLIQTANSMLLVSLGEVRLDVPPVGSMRWYGQIQAMGSGGENVWFDELLLQPLDEGSGTLKYNSAATSLEPVSAYDSFTETAGNLTGTTAPIGGAWSGAGSPTDFTINSTNQDAERTAVSETMWDGRYALLGPSAAKTDVSVQVTLDQILGTNSGVQHGVIARYQNTSNWLIGGLVEAASGLDNSLGLAIYKCVAGTVTQLATTLPLGWETGALVNTIRMTVDTAGNVALYVTNASTTPLLTASDPALATGGTLASGQTGMYDENPSGLSQTRQFDNFTSGAASGGLDPIASDAVIYANHALELRHDKHLRQDPNDGSYYGPLGIVVGDLARLPPAGMENRPCQLLVKPSRGDLGGLADAGIDSFTIQAAYRPCWLSRP